jgi:tetratricopeptide (TPR) repeat protein
VEWYRYATYLNPDLELAYYHSALAYLALYKPGSKHPKDLRYAQEALKNLRRYLENHPDNEDAKNYLLTVYLGAERYDEAAAFFEAELKAKGSADPAVASKLMQVIGMIYAKKGDFDTSLEWYKKRADLEKDNAEVLYTIGVLCWDKVYHAGLTLELDRRQQLIDMGLDYLNRASTLRQDYFEAVSYINLMYREKAKVAQLVGDNDSYVKYNDEATKYMKMALEMRKKVMAAK